MKKYIVISLLTCIAAFVLVAGLLLSGERPKSEFADYSEAKASGLMDKGWIPTFIPKSAINIQEQHDMDSNWVKMYFDYTPGDVDDTRKSCNSEEVIEGGIEFKCVYFSSNVSLKLLSNGKAEMYSSPN